MAFEKKKKRITTIDLVKEAIPSAFKKFFNLFRILQNPTMAVVFFVNILLTFFLLHEFIISSPTLLFHSILLAVLWMTSLFANFAEAIAEGRGKAQATSLKTLQSETEAKRLLDASDKEHFEVIAASELEIGNLVIIKRGDIIPCDGEVIAGIALINESTVTGESAPVIREAGGDVSAVTGGTVVISDWIVIRITARSGEGFLQKMIHLVEGARRKKTPNEQALHIILTGFTLVFLIVVATLNPLYQCSSRFLGHTLILDPFIAISLLICLIPTTIGGLLPAIGIAGMDRMIQHNILATDPKAIEAAGDVDTLLLDKTGTITLGNRQAFEFFCAPDIEPNELTEAVLISSLSDETPEGKSIVRLAREVYGHTQSYDQTGWIFTPFTAKTRMSGIECNLGTFHKGAPDTINKLVNSKGNSIPPEVHEHVAIISRKGGTPLLVTKNYKILGTIFLKDIVKPGLKERFSLLRKMGIRTVMITGDNQLTATAIAAEAGVDECFGQVTPEDKLHIIQKYQEKGHLVAMTGDGSNDAPALAKADVAMAMNNGTQAAREAANLIDLDSDPTKLIEAVGIGKQLLMTRGALTTFSIANDAAKYFVLIPVIFLPICPDISAINIMNLHSSNTACLSCVLFNALTILALVPLALRGVHYKSINANRMFCRNLGLWGTCGLLIPFVGIKLLDLIVSLFV